MAASTLLLKDSRKFIDDDDNYKEEQVCPHKLLLKEEDNLYLIFPIKSLGGFNKARLAVKRGVPGKSITSEQVELATYSEQYQDIIQEILSIYNELLRLNIENEKVLDILTNVAKIGFYFNNVRAIHILLNYLGNIPAVKIYVVGKYQLFQILKANTLQDTDNFSVENYLAHKKILESIYDLVCISMAKITLRRKRMAKAFEEITQWPIFSLNTIFRNWLCKYLCSYFIQLDSFELDILKYKTGLTEGIENSKYSKLLTSMIYYNLKLYSEAFNYKYLVNFNDIEDIEAVFLTKCLYMLKQWINTERFVIKILYKVKDTYYSSELQKLLFLSYAEQKKWSNAIKVSREMEPISNFGFYDISVLAKCYIENEENADHLMQYLQMTKYYKQLQALVLIKRKKFDEVIKLLDAHTKDPVECLYIAKSYWQLNKLDTCYLYLIRATIHDPNSADIYYHMGLYYQDVKRNTKMTKICLEKAYRFNTADINIIKSLSDFYIKNGYKTDNFMLLKGVSHYVMDQSWIYYYIGQYYFDYKQWENAIKYLLKAIKCNDKYVDAYDSLAEAYTSLGYLKSAHESYRKLTELNPKKKIYYLTRIGHICTALKQFDEAIITFEQVLEFQPYNLLAIRGITETWMKFATVKFNSKLYHIARGAAQTAINYLIAILSINKRVIPLWKFLGDAILYISKLPDDYCFVQIRFNRNVELGNLGTLYIKANMYKLAYYCFWRARSILPLHLENLICSKVADEIFEEEESADLFRYSCPTDLGIGYAEWVKSTLSESSQYSRLCA